MEPVGIFAAIHLSPSAYQRFCADHGACLVEDIRYIKANQAAVERISERMKDFHDGNPSFHQLQYYFSDPANSFIHNQIGTPDGYFHDPRNRLVVRYEESSGVLFFLYTLEVRTPDAMESVPAYQVLKRIIDYKDVDSGDIVAFSSSAPNMLVSPIWRAFQVGVGAWQPIPPTAVSDHEKERLWALAARHYWKVHGHAGHETVEDGCPAPRYPHGYLDAGLMAYASDPLA